ncbi:Siderophore iron transporter 1 [Exophiala dermatitidis]
MSELPAEPADRLYGTHGAPEATYLDKVPNATGDVDNSETMPADHVALPLAKESGVVRMEAIYANLDRPTFYLIFTGLLLAGYANGLDVLTRSTYQAYATASYEQHSALATVNVIKGVVAAAMQTLIAKLSDVFGRAELLGMVVASYVIGTIVQAAADGVASFSVGAIFYQIGSITTSLLQQIIIADITSVRSRTFWMCIPDLGYIINVWISGNVTESVLATTSWRWGIGMWAIIFPVCSILIIVSLMMAARKAEKRGGRFPPRIYARGINGMAREFFQKFDLIGVVLLSGALAMVLIPLTLAGGTSSKWRSAGIITPLVLGGLCIPAFAFWERKASNPLVPAHLLKDRAVYCALAMSTCIPLAFTIQGDFLYTVLVVAFDFSIEGATRIASVYNCVGMAFAALTGLLVRKIRRLKEVVLVGIALYFVAYGLLFHYRGGSGRSSRAGVLAAQLLLGFAGGMLANPVFISLQTTAKHKHMAVVISLALTVNQVGTALGNCISGAIWTQTLYQELEKNMAPFHDDTLAASIYADPFTAAATYAVGTPEREAIIVSYRYIQKLLTITGICILVPILAFAFGLRNPVLSDETTQPEAERKSDR